MQQAEPTADQVWARVQRFFDDTRDDRGRWKRFLNQLPTDVRRMSDQQIARVWLRALAVVGYNRDDRRA